MAKFLLNTSLVTAIVTAKILPQTVLLNMRRKFRARYGFDDKEIPIQENIQQRIQEVMDDLNISEKNRNGIKFFNVHDVDVYHAGLAWTSFGGIIGIPVNFEYQDVQSITDQTITLQYVSIDWSTEPAKQFRDSLILSENAQKFAIASKILSVIDLNMVSVVSSVMDAIIGVLAYNMAITYMNITKNQRFKRISLLGVTILGIYAAIACTDRLSADESTLRINTKLTALGSDYIQGGVEYYEKLSKRNKALRILLGERGKYLFTSDGNEFSWFINKSVPISQQLNYFSKSLQTM